MAETSKLYLLWIAGRLALKWSLYRTDRFTAYRCRNIQLGCVPTEVGQERYLRWTKYNCMYLMDRWLVTLVIYHKASSHVCISNLLIPIISQVSSWTWERGCYQRSVRRWPSYIKAFCWRHDRCWLDSLLLSWVIIVGDHKFHPSSINLEKL